MTPTVLIALCARENIFESLCRAFGFALSELTGEQVADAQLVDQNNANRIRTQILRLLQEVHPDDQQKFVALYRQAIQEAEPSFAQAPLRSADIAEELFAIANTSPLAFAAWSRDITHDDYSCIAAHALGALPQERFLLAPLVYWTNLPCTPLEAVSDCSQRICKLAVRHGAISIPAVVDILATEGIEVSENFVKAIVVCEPRLLLSRHGEWQVEILPGRFDRLDLCAHNVPRDTYLRTRSIFGPNDDGDYESRLVAAPTLNNVPVESLLRSPKAANVELDPKVVAIKLLQRSLQGERQTQGISASLHKEVVRQLKENRRAMSRAELEGAIGFQIMLSPETLPPGRIMAYAPGDRFLRPDTAYYVLQEWVETDTEKRNRILRARIVTPFKEKSTNFSDEILLRTVREDPLYRTFGIAVATHLANHIALKLPDAPTELYFLNVIRKRIESRLAQSMISIGRSAYISLSHAIERDDGESMDAWRRRVIAKVVGCDEDELVERLQKYDPPVSERLREVAFGQ